MKKSKQPPKKPPEPTPFDEAGAIRDYAASHAAAVEVFGAEYVKAHPEVALLVHDITPDLPAADDARSMEKYGEALKAVVDDLKLAREVAEHFTKRSVVTSSATPEPLLHDDVFGVYDRVLDVDGATGEPEHLEMIGRVAAAVFGEAPSIEIVFDLFDREFGSPYEDGE